MSREKFIRDFEELAKKYYFDLDKMKLTKWERLKRFPFFTIRNSSILNRLIFRLLTGFEAKTFFNEKMFTPKANTLWRYGAVLYDAEVRFTKFILKNIRDNIVFFDIGANIGYYSLLVHSISVDSQVYAFEPDPIILKFLRKNQRENIKIVDKAVSEINGPIDFYSSSAYQALVSTINPDIFESGEIAKVDDFKKVEVRAVTLDSFCQENNIYPDFIKINIEGGEEKALKGAKNLLENYSPVIGMEVWIKPFTPAHKNAIDILKENKFSLYSIKDDGILEKIEHNDLERYFNYILNKYKEMKNAPPVDNFIFKK